jgi:hypothetical protein
VVAVVVALAIGSVAEIHAQSAGYRQLTDAGYGVLATQVIDASNQTGTQLATLVKNAPTIPNAPYPTVNGRGVSVASQTASVAGHSARAVIQQGLDAAVTSAQQEAVQAAQLSPPAPAGNLGARLSAILSDRATAVTNLRATVDRLLGMAPLSVAGAPTSATSPPGTASDGVGSITAAEASREAAAEGAVFQQSDRTYAVLAAQLRRGQLTGTGPIHLPTSVWARSGSSLTAAHLGGMPVQLAPPSGSAALVPFHRLIVTAAGLVPPAVPSAVGGDLPGSGIVATSCVATTQAAVPGTTATVLPPTPTVAVQVTVTNCGTVTEVKTPVTATLALADSPGIAAPPAGDTGGTAHATVTVISGGSQALTLGGLHVAGGHNYTLTIAVHVRTGAGGQANRTNATQKFLLQIAK